MLHILSPFFLLFAFFGAFCSAQPLVKRAMQFNIYAFGESISGLQVYYADGVASIGDPSQSNATDVLPVYFTASSTSSDQYTWTAHSASEVQSAAVSDKVLYLANDGSDKVGFVSSSERSATDSKLTNVWWLYGRYVMTKIDGATFYAEPTSNGWYKLTWSTADQSGTNKKLVTLRTIEPSTNSVLA